MIRTTAIPIGIRLVGNLSIDQSSQCSPRFCMTMACTLLILKGHEAWWKLNQWYISDSEGFVVTCFIHILLVYWYARCDVSAGLWFDKVRPLLFCPVMHRTITNDTAFLHCAPSYGRLPPLQLLYQLLSNCTRRWIPQPVGGMKTNHWWTRSHRPAQDITVELVRRLNKFYLLIRMQ